MNSTVTTGLTEKTVKNIFVDAGAIYSNYGTESEKLLGAVSGGNEFEVKNTFWSPSIAGAISSHIKGLEFIKDSVITLKASFIELTESILKMALIGKIDTATSPTYDIITTNTSFTAADYIDNIALVGTLSGTTDPIIIIIKNALVLDGLKFKAEDSKDNTLDVTFTAHGDPAKPKELPYEIHYPKSNLPA